MLRGPRLFSNEVTRSRVGHFWGQMIRDTLKGTNDLREDPPLREDAIIDGCRELVPLERRTPHVCSGRAGAAAETTL